MVRIVYLFVLISTFACANAYAQDNPKNDGGISTTSSHGFLEFRKEQEVYLKWFKVITETSCLEFVGGGMIPKTSSAHRGASAIAASEDGNTIEVFTDLGMYYVISKSGEKFSFSKANSIPFTNGEKKLEGVARGSDGLILSYDAYEPSIQDKKTVYSAKASLIEESEKPQGQDFDFGEFVFKDPQNGFEAVARLSNGVVFIEEKDEHKDMFNGWFFRNGTRQNGVRFYYPKEGLYISGATAIENDLFVLERYHYPTTGPNKNDQLGDDVAFRIVMYRGIDPSDEGFRKESLKLFNAKREVLIDFKGQTPDDRKNRMGLNFEGISAFKKEKNGPIYLYLISDNNINDDVGTALVLFKVKKECPRKGNGKPPVITEIPDGKSKESLAVHLIEIALNDNNKFEEETQVIALRRLAKLGYQFAKMDDKSLGCKLTSLLNKLHGGSNRLKYHGVNCLIDIADEQIDKETKANLYDSIMDFAKHCKTDPELRRHIIESIKAD